MTKDRTGFTLIDLMIAVAILGVLLSIAAPRYQNFRARSSQTFAKTELTSAYTAQVTFRQEFKTYHWDLPLTGFVPKGLSSTALGTALTGSRRRYVIYGYYDVVTVVTPVGSAASLGLTASTNYDPLLGYGADPGSCELAATGNRYNMVDATTPGAVPYFTPTSFTFVALGCPAENVRDPGDSAAENAAALSSLDAITMDHQSVIRVSNTKYK